MKSKKTIITPLLLGMLGTAQAEISLHHLSTVRNPAYVGHEEKLFDEDAAEIVSYDPLTQRIFVTNSFDYDGFSEETRVGDIIVNRGLARLQDDEDLGRLRTTTTPPRGTVVREVDGNPVSVQNTLFAYGARSFSIWTTNGGLVFDSEDDFERITADVLGENFNSTNTENDSGDSRSDDKGPEPEGVAVGEVDGKTYAFIGLERVGGIMIYDVTDPKKPAFCTYARDTLDFSVAFDEDNLDDFAAVGDLGPEGLEFIPASSSPTGEALLVVASEVSGTTSVYVVVP